MLQILGKYQTFFPFDRKTFGERPLKGDIDSSHTAVVKVVVNGESAIAVAQGNGPVHSLDKAIRKVLESFYPLLSTTYLTDFKVRVLDSKQASAATVRVLIETSDGRYSWSTVGVSSNSSKLVDGYFDAIEYKLRKGVSPPI